MPGIVVGLEGAMDVPVRDIDVDETPVVIKNTGGWIMGWHIHNAAAATSFVKFYDLAAADVTLGTSPVYLTIPIAAGATEHIELERGIPFVTGISMCAVTGVADNDTTGVGANEIIANIFFR